jgi:predicted flap endonuclease-1-like 5' DNA nuclease
MSDLLQEAIAGLGINVPIYRTEEQNDTLVLYLYGGRVVRWPKSEISIVRSTMATAGGDPDPDPVTTSPRISIVRPTMATAGDEFQDPPVTTPSPPPRGGDTEGGLDNLTVIPGVGKATAAALNKAGFPTFRSLINADDADILAVPKLNTYTLGKIRSYLYVHFL